MNTAQMRQAIADNPKWTAIAAMQQLFDKPPTSTHHRQAMQYGGMRDRKVVQSIPDQADALLDQIERPTGIRFLPGVVFTMIELRADVTVRSDDYVIQSALGREIADQLLLASIPKQDDIAGLYRGALRREPDAGGLEHYRDKLANGDMTLGQICDELYYNRASDFERRGLAAPVNHG